MNECPGNPGFLVATYKSSDKVLGEMSPGDLADPDEVNVGNYAKVRIYRALFTILMEVWRPEK